MEDGEGFEVWWKLIHPQAPVARLVGLVASPPKISDFAKVAAEIRMWEDHHRTLTKAFRETFSDTVKVGILLQMLPKQAHDLVLQTLGR